jgi:hypothetical protein
MFFWKFIKFGTAGSSPVKGKYFPVLPPPAIDESSYFLGPQSCCASLVTQSSNYL